MSSAIHQDKSVTGIPDVILNIIFSFNNYYFVF